MFSNYETLRIDPQEAHLTLWLNRPDARNAMNLKMCEEIIDFFSHLRFEASVRAVVIRAEGTAFCAGVDLREVSRNNVQWVSRRRNMGLDAFLAIESCPLPVVCAVQGPSIGAGCEIAAACDFAVATHDAFFQWPEALRGGVGATQRLPRAVGRGMAKELLFTARRITAQEARDIGFINRVVHQNDLNATIEECVGQIAACGPLAVKLIKQAINIGETLDRNSAVNVERQLIEHSLACDEWRQSIPAFAKNT